MASEPTAADAEDATAVLRARDLTIDYRRRGVAQRAVSDVSFDLAKGTALGIVGESGSGKSTVAYGILGLLPVNAQVVRGAVYFGDTDLGAAAESDRRAVRGSGIALVSQDPMAALNPVMTIGAQISEAVRAHARVPRAAARRRAVDLLEMVRVPDPAGTSRVFPHQLSGGMRQRVAIAMAVSAEPAVLIADEPTTALDVSIQDQILRLLGRLRRDLGMALIVVSHSLGVVAALTDQVMIMYRGYQAEMGPTQAVLRDPRHPYTTGLIESVPDLRADRPETLRSIRGRQDPMFGDATECPFVGRCEHAADQCRDGLPVTRDIASGHRAACVLADEATSAANPGSR